MRVSGCAFAWLRRSVPVHTGIPKGIAYQLAAASVGVARANPVDVVTGQSSTSSLGDRKLKLSDSFTNGVVGFDAATGQVFLACAKIVKWYAEKGTTFYLGENVDSTVALNKKMNDSYDSNAVVMNGDDVSGMRRKRQIRTNFPPALDLTEELDGTKPHRQASTCIDADSAMHPDRKKVHCSIFYLNSYTRRVDGSK